jgi:hypothetical protein
MTPAIEQTATAMRNRKSNFIAVGIVAACLLIAGCAVMTVDVDVYKGPLANTEQIQGEQAISLVMGAKPLLVQLRDELEVSDYYLYYPFTDTPIRPVWPPHSLKLERAMKRFRTNSWYEAGYMEPYHYPLGTNDHIFKNEFAIQVNEILALYKDQTPEGLAAPLNRIEDLLQQYKHHFHVLHPSDIEPEIEFWNNIKPRLRTEDSNNAVLITNYGNFFARLDYSKIPGSFVDWPFLTNGLSTKDSSTSSPSASSPSTNSPSAKEDNAVTNATRHDTKNDEFKKLLEGKLERDAVLLFANTNAPQMQMFTNHVQEISQAYFDAREDIHQLLLTALQMVPEAQSLQSLDKPSLAKLQTAVAELVTPLISANRLARQMQYDPDGALKARFSAILSSGILTSATTTGGTPTNGALTNITFDGILHSSYTNQSDWDFVSKAIKTLIQLDDGSIFGKLLQYDRNLMADGKSYDWYGLAYSPVAEPEDDSPAAKTDEKKGGGKILHPNGVANMVQSFQTTAGGSLSRGRSAKGLETLIEDYLRQDTKYRNPAAWQTNGPFLDLMDALAEFGEKVVTLGNGARFLDGAKDRSANNYIMVLQSVGNSIIVQIDELKARAANERNLQGKSHLFGEALNQSGGFTNAGLENWPPTNIPADAANGVTFDAKDAAEQLENILRLEYLKELHAETESTNKNATDKPVAGQLAQATNVELHLELADNGMVTNARITTPAFELETNKIMLNIAGTNMTPNLGPEPSNSTAGTNLVVHLDISPEGILTNAKVSITPPTNNGAISGAVSPGGQFSVTLKIDTNAMITNCVSSNMDGFKPANSVMDQLSITLTVDGGIVKTNSANTNAPASNPSADKFLAAIQAATDLRAGMIYLRPAGSYLRSSFTASTALDDQSQGWHNMLEQQAWRATPIIPGLWHKWQPGNSAIISELDKQSWQNINRIRVAGMYKVNYVLAKDDIGNWYVKGLSDDPTNVFSSMFGLAQYAAGGSLPALSKGALTNLAAAVASASGSASNAASQSNGVLTNEFYIVASNYLATSSQVYSNASRDGNGLYNKLTNDISWKNLTTYLTTNNSANTNVPNLLASDLSNAFASFSNALSNASAVVDKISFTNATNGSVDIGFASTYNQQTISILSAAATCMSDLQTNILNSQILANGQGFPMDMTNVIRITGAFQSTYLDQQTKALDACEADVNLISHVASGK